MVYFKYIVIDLVININWKSRLLWNTNDAISSLWYIASGLPFCNTFIKFLISHYLQDLLACFSWLELLETYFLKIYFIFFKFGMLLLSLVKTLYQNNLECIWDSERPPKLFTCCQLVWVSTTFLTGTGFVLVSFYCYHFIFVDVQINNSRKDTSNIGFYKE